MDTLQAYDILRQRQTNEDRIVAERLSVGCLVNSILMIAFFTAVSTPYFYWVRFVLPLFGIIFSLGLVFVLLVSAKAMIGWYDALCKLEQKADFDYMKDEKIRPFTDVAGMTAEGKNVWKLGFYVSPLFPLPFIVIWLLFLFFC